MAVVASGDDVLLNSGGDMVVENISSAGGIALNSGGTMTTGDLDAANSIAATSAQTMQILSASAGQDVSLTSATDLVVGNVDAGGAATFVAGGLAGFLGLVAAPTITVTSGGLFIDEGAGLGVSGLTSLITFNAVSDGTVIIGGEDSAESGYQLTADGDISADAVVVNAVAGNDVILRDLEIEGSETSGGGVSSVTLNTGGSVIVEGAVDYINAGSGDVLAINSGEVIEVITDTGSISMTDSAGNLAGTLELTAHDIWVADQTVIDQLEVDPNFAGLEAALATNNGPVNADGYIQAGGVTATMLGSSLLVQNSGTAENPAGLTVGDGGLTVINLGNDPATVIVYGQQMNSDGTVVGGDAFVENVDFSGSGGFSGDSSVNGCDVSGTCAGDGGTETPGTGAESILGPIGLMGSTSGDGAPDDSEDEEEEEEGDDKTAVDPSVNLINTSPLHLDTTVDEPITSGSDSPGGQTDGGFNAQVRDRTARPGFDRGAGASGLGGADQRSRQLPDRKRWNHHLLGPACRHGSGARRHVRRRLFRHLPRRGASGRQALQVAVRERPRVPAGVDAQRAGELRRAPFRHHRGPRQRPDHRLQA